MHRRKHEAEKQEEFQKMLNLFLVCIIHNICIRVLYTQAISHIISISVGKALRNRFKNKKCFLVNTVKAICAALAENVNVSHRYLTSKMKYLIIGDVSVHVLARITDKECCITIVRNVSSFRTYDLSKKRSSTKI